MTRDDAQIISKILSGDSSAYQALFERYAVSVEEVIARVWELELSDQAELVEETFVHAFSNLARLREPSRFGAYVLGIAYGMALQRRAIVRGSEVHFSEKPSFDVSCLRRPGTQAEMELVLKEALASLDPEARQIAEESYFEDQERPQLMAARCSLEVAQIGTQLQKAWIRFKAFLISLLLEPQKSAALEGLVPEDAPESLHLTEELYEMLLRGEGVPAPMALTAHLRTACPTCEAFLNRRLSADALDGLLAAALFVKEGRNRRNNPLFQRILRRLKIDARLNGEQQGLFKAFDEQRNLVPILFAVLLGLAGIVVFALRMTPSFQASLDERVQRDLELAFYLADRPSDASGQGTQEDEPLIEGVSGQATPSSQQLILRYRLLRSRFVAITRIRPDHSLELLELPGRRSPGSHHLSINGIPARLLLEDSVGRNRFVVFASERPIGVEQLTGTLAFLQTDTPSFDNAAIPEGMSLVWFDLDVRPDPARALPER